MTELTQLFAVIAVLTGVITSFSVWAPRRLWLKASAFALALLFLPAAYVGLSRLLSMPKPAQLEWWHAQAEEATVLASSLRENEAIYLWLQMDALPEPRAYALPWNRDLAEQLQAAQREAAENQTQVQMRLPFERSEDDQEPRFYAMPQPAQPPKDLDRSPPQIHRRQAQNDA
jgi:hypothetical protein